jgi:formyl-CoA transferase
VLSDLVVLDLSRALAGPHAAMLLADLGARVIKVESPGGDETRTWGPPFVGEASERLSTYFMSCNRNKESVVLDLKSAEGIDLLERLVRRADVLIENFRAGVMERLGFSLARLHELNPRLVLCSITGFGHDGPEASRPGYDQILQGEAGLMSLTGEPDGEPTRVGVPIGDLLAGIHAAYGVCAALHERNRTGRGTVVRTSLLAGLIGVHAFQGTRWTVAGEEPARVGNHHPSIAPYGLFRTSDGSVQVAVGTQAQWEVLARLINVTADHPDFANNERRVANRAKLIDVIETAFESRTSADILTELTEASIPAGRVRTLPEVYAWDQVRSQGLLLTVDDPDLGPIELPGPVLRLGEDATPGTRARHSAPPRLGEHNDDIISWLNDVETADKAQRGD